jgi:PAS domain-containing protein
LYLGQYRDIEEQLRSDVRTLRELTLDNAGQQLRIQRLSPWMQTVLDGPDVKISEFLRELIVVAREMDGVEAQLLDNRVRQSNSSAWAAYATIGASTALSLVLLGAIWYVTRRELVRRLHNEQQLQGAKARLQMVLDNIPQRVFWQDLKQRFVGANRAFVADTGKSRRRKSLAARWRIFNPQTWLRTTSGMSGK